MLLTTDAHLVICRGERAFLDQSGQIWVHDRSKAGLWPESEALRLCMAVEWPYGRRHINITPVLACQCCGSLDGVVIVASSPQQTRCWRHEGRNPCAIEGCKRTREGNRPATDSWLCGAHWRLVSRRSKAVYSRIWRLQKKSGGWTHLLARRHRRIWGAMLLEAQRAARGDVDMQEIGELFGWGDA